MENQLIEIYLFICQIYDTCSQTCFQRTSNNRHPRFTDEELISIWFFGHLHEKFTKRQIYRFICQQWRSWFPCLPSYQTFCYRLNLLEATFQSIGGALFEQLRKTPDRQDAHLLDSFPVMLARHGFARTARVAREVANFGYCAAKKTYFHGVRLHFIAARRGAKLPVPEQVFLREASTHDATAALDQRLALAKTTLFADLAYRQPALKEHFLTQDTRLLLGCKKPQGGKLSKAQKHFNRLISHFRQPIESLFNWINEKTHLQTASKVRSLEGLMLHCWGKLAVAFYLLVFKY